MSLKTKKILNLRLLRVLVIW